MNVLNLLPSISYENDGVQINCMSFVLVHDVFYFTVRTGWIHSVYTLPGVLGIHGRLRFHCRPLD